MRLTHVIGIALAIGTTTWSIDHEPIYMGRAVFDFRRGLLITDQAALSLTDCSQDGALCLSVKNGPRVSVPLFCENVKVGDVWVTGTVKTSVLSSYELTVSPDISPPGYQHAFWLGSRDDPYTVWSYESRTGLLGFIHDKDRKIDLVSLAIRGEIGAWSSEMRKTDDAKWLSMQFYRRKEQPLFGACVPVLTTLGHKY